MAHRLKKFVILMVSLIVVLSCLSGCFPLASSEINVGHKSGTENTGENVEGISQKIYELIENVLPSPVLLSHKSGEIIYGSGDKELIFIKGYADEGNKVEVYVNGQLAGDNLVVNSNGNFETLNGVEIVEGENNIELISVDSAGRKSSPTEFSLFLVVPQKVEYKLYKDNLSLEEIDDSLYTEEIDPLVFVYGTHLPSSKVSIQVNDKMAGEIECDSSGIFQLSGVMLQQGSNEIAVWAKSADGFISAPVFKDLMVYRDLNIPYPVNLTGYEQGDANYLNWSVSPDTDFDSYKIVRVEDPCVNPEYPVNDVIATFSDVSTNSYIDDDIVSENSYYYTVWALDKAGKAVSSNVVAIPKPVYSISIKPLTSSEDPTISRREWFYQPFEITNTGNVAVNIQPFMVWVKLEPSFDEDEEISPIWEVHLWNPNDNQYYYSDEDIYETYVADWAKTSGYTIIEEETEYSEDGLTRTDTVTETTEITEFNEVNLKRVMTTSTVITITETDLSTGIITTTTASDATTDLVAPENIGSPIEGLEPGETIVVEVKIQNIAAENGEKIIAHFHFAPVDCDGHYYTDEIVSTGDVTAIGRSRS
jgi:hypothetical protein